MYHAEQGLKAEVIPLIDLSDFNDATARIAISANIRAACLSVGFFLIKGHGVPKEICDAAAAASRRYFALPEEERIKDLIDPRFRRGFMPSSDGQREVLESFELSLDLPLDDPDVMAGHFLHGPNRWPADKPWLHEAVEPYRQAVLALGERLERLFALSLDLDENYFVELCRKPTFHLRLMHNMPQTEEEKKDHMAVGEHTDFGMLTILMQDPNGGLEVQTRDGEWVKAPYVEDTFVINVGDMLELWTNNLYVSTPHRVIGLTGQDRYSIPAFFSPSFDTLVECIPSCLAPGEKPKFAPLQGGEYLTQRLSRESDKVSDEYEGVGGHRKLAI
ncbi:isopenicillin N synthase family dioxygenase [Sphingobium boeckii]|uniref:2-oxoglutarate-dependent ethylene/succinate-forming enzyme n=1 Tax=Sphingobium boeckii TaxID=1082345 RepID=A0A7W9EFI0_9SPHN|nr:isopenicillin N synthase family oxygenase [Sphingobium boeckii]MBB5685716.1 isopenicillin N synthase-like dioxygenase [Sphingobium boeckii]